MDASETAAMTEASGLTNDQHGLENPLREKPWTKKQVDLGRSAEELAERLRNNRLYRLATGPAGQQLGTSESSVPRQLGPIDFELGVIAGDRSLNPLFSLWIPGADDGKVSVRGTQMPRMRDFLVVHRSHTWMAWSRKVTEAVTQFLRSGCFIKS